VLDNLKADIRYAFRWLRRSPGFTLIAIASLAIGIGFNSALFTLVDALLFRPLPIERVDRLVDVFTTGGDGDVYATSSYPDFLDFKARNEVLTDMLAYSPSMDAVKLTDRARLAMGETVTGNYFQLLGVKAALGRTLLPEDDRSGAPRAVVISNRLWKREFGASPSAVGQSIRIHGMPYTIVGVAPSWFTGMVPLLSAELWTPMAYVEEIEPGGIISTVPSPTGNTRLERRGQRWMFVKGRLKDGVTVDAAAANLRLIGKQLQSTYVQTNKDRDVATLATKDVHIHPVADRSLMPVALGLMLVVGLVLLVACANVASMLLARASGRQKEIGIRLAIGATRGRLVQQLLSESLVMSALGALAGIALAWWLTRAAMSMTLPIPIPISIALGVDGRVLAFTSIVAMLSALVAGLAPALKATRANLVADLKSDVAVPQSAGRRWTLRDGLVAAQIAATLVLLVTAGLLTRSFLATRGAGIGFEPAGLAIVSTELNMIGYDDARAKTFYERAIERVRAIPGVESAAIAERLPLSINYNRNVIVLPDRQGPNDKGTTIDVARVSAEYFPTLGIAMLQGRNFLPSDTPTSPNVAIVNEAFARKYWPNESAVGKRFRQREFTGPEYQIVGVSADYKVSTLGEATTPYIHYPVSQRPDKGEEIVARTTPGGITANALLAAMRRELLALEPNLVFLDNETMEAQVDTVLLPAKAGAMSVAIVGGVAMLLASIGLYGVIAYSVARRTREIGIRMALGARPSEVVALVMRQGMKIAGVGAGVGAILALGAARVVAGMLYRVGFADPVAWTASIALLMTVAALANIIPARRAAVVDPSVALRNM